MKAQCILCDTVNDLEDDSLKAKRLRNRQVNMYLCPECYERITNKTKERYATGNFRLYSDNSRKKKDLI
ncbi:YlaI family protein [Barrientosiimonas marina]|uniref:YlaI family protein n=1 Tax=Lentibacillus kimchii TaxID=1542911 RepID=A0ABW2UTQ3_9BACI